VIRRLLLALALSAAVHGSILVAAAWLPAPAGGPPAAAIDFDVVEREAVVEEPVEPAAAEPRRPHAPPPGRPAPGTPDAVPPARPAPAAPEASPGETPPAVGALAAADALPATADGVPVAVAATAAPGALGGGGSASGVAAGTGPGGPGVSSRAGSGAGGGSPHGAILARLRARTAGCYPRAAVRRAVEGVTHVSFCVASDGAPADLRLVASSGSTVLDDAAVDCVVRGAAPLPGAGACVQVPIDFHLRR
jgi:TonB family protein